MALLLTTFFLIKTSPARLELVLEKVGSWALNRELKIGKLVEARLNWDAYLVATDITLANPEWTENPYFVEVGVLQLRINLPSIWRSGPFVIDELDLTDVSVELLGESENPANWNFWPEAEVEPSRAVASDKNVELIFPFIIRNGHVDGGGIRFQGSNKNFTLSVDQLTLREPDPAAPIYLDASGSIDDMPLALEGHIGPSVAMLTRRNLLMDLSIALGELSLKAKGSIENLRTLSGPDLHLGISAPRSRRILKLFGITGLGDGSLSLKGHLTDAQPGLAVDIVGALNEIDVKISGTMADPMKFEGVDLAVNFDGPSVREVGTLLGFDDLPDGPYLARGNIFRDDSGLGIRSGVLHIGEGRLELDGRMPDFPKIDDWELVLGGTNFDLALLGALVGAHDVSSASYDVKGSLRSDAQGVELAELELAGVNTHLLLKGTIGEASGYLGSRVTLELNGNDLAVIAPWLGLDSLPSSVFRLIGEVYLDENGWHMNDAVFSSEELDLGLSAQIDKFPEPDSMAAEIELNSPDIASIGRMFAIQPGVLPAEPVSVVGKLSGSLKALRIDDMIISSGDSTMNLSGTVGDLAVLEGVDLTVSLLTPDVLKFLPGRDEYSSLKLAFNGSGQVVMTDEGLGIKALEGSIGEGSVAMQGLFNIRPPFNNSRFTLNASGPNLGAVLSPMLRREIPVMPFQLSMDASFSAGGVKMEKLEATIAKAELNAQISMASMEDASSVQGSFSLAGPSSNQLLKVMGIAPPIPNVKYVLSVGVKHSPDDWLLLDPIAVQWGSGDLSGRVAYRPGDVAQIDVDLHSNVVDISFLIPSEEELKKKEAESIANSGDHKKTLDSRKLTATEQAKRVIPDEPLNFGWLTALEGPIRYKVDKILLGESNKSEAVVDISLSKGVLSTHTLSWNGSFLIGEADLTMRSQVEGAELDVYFNMNRLPLASILGGEPRYDSNAFYRARLATEGESWRQMAQRLNGALVFRAGGARFDNTVSGLILGDFMEEIANRVNPFKDTSKYTKIVCHGGALAVVNGKVSISPGVVAREKRLDFVLGGELDLATEQLNLTFNSRSRKGLGISAGKAITPYFKLGGTLAYPRIVVDPKGVALSGSAAVATGGISILAEGLWDRWVLTASNPCKNVIKSAGNSDNNMLRELLNTP